MQAAAGASDTVSFFISPKGNDAAAGTSSAPRRTIAGAQALIRATYPNVSARPAIRVLIQPGNYYFGEDSADHLRRATRYSNLALATFTESDSGSSPSSPIIYTAAEGPGTVHFVGGFNLNNLEWSVTPDGSGFPPGVITAKIPGTVQFDSQDQLFVSDSAGKFYPLIRARTPNGKPWIPKDNFNLTAAGSFGSLNDVKVATTCASSAGAPANAGPPPARPKPPRPADPSPGMCDFLPHISLLNGLLPEPEHTITPNASECSAACTHNPCCRGFTWHDSTTGQFFRRCYLVTPATVPLTTDVWKYAAVYKGHQSGLCNHSNVTPPPNCSAPTPTPPSPPPPPPPHQKGSCTAATVLCSATNATQITGFVGDRTAASASLLGPGAKITVDKCLEHALDLANDWPKWAASSFGITSPCNFSDPSSCVNTLDTTYNFPLWYGPWAAGIGVDTTQATGSAGKTLANCTWVDAANMVVHAMADGDWGGSSLRSSR